MTRRDNDTRHPDPRQELAEELAESLVGGTGYRVARLLGVLSAPAAPEVVGGPELSDPSRSEPGPPADEPDRPPAIGVWTPRLRSGRWVYDRPPVHPLGDHHAARLEFERRPAAGTRRIVFLGESVAAGYLLAPHWTPAQALEERLHQLAPDHDFEVVDLARTNEKLSTLVATWEASRVLEPEVWVIFAGNNWNLLDDPPTTLFPTAVRDRQELAMALAAEGWEGPVRRARRRLHRRVDAAFDRLAAGASESGARVVWVLPEVDLDTWEVAQPLAWTPSPGGVRRWHRLHRECLERFATEDPAGALERADAMTRIDGGHQPTSHRLRARAYRALGQHDAAHQAASEAVDGAALGRLGALASPQVDSEIQGWIRTLASRHGFTLVDLPWIFAREGELPGRRLFLDYCHLSSEGIGQAMAATADAVLEVLGHPSGPTGEVVAGSEVPPAIDALAAVGAAIHGAHRHLPVDGGAFDAEHWLRRAVALDPLAVDTLVADTLIDLAEARSGPLPGVLGQAQQRQLMRDPRLLLQHGWRWDHLDADLLLALLSVLDDLAPERSAAIRRRLLFHHGVENGPRELSRAPYLWQPLARLLPEVLPETEASRRATLRSPWPTTDLTLVAGETRGVLLDLVVRRPTVAGWMEPEGESYSGDSRGGEVVIVLDGLEVGRLPCDETWSRGALRLPASRRAGPLHRLTLAWPEIPEADEPALANALEQLEEGREADLFPIFGEVARARASRPRPEPQGSAEDQAERSPLSKPSPKKRPSGSR